MDAFASLADVLQQYVKRTGYSAGQLAKLTAIPKATIINWLSGRVSKPRDPQDLLKLAAALYLNETEATRLLTAAGYPEAEMHRLLTSGNSSELVREWVDSTQQSVAPFQAIADLPYFVGRGRELFALEQALLNPDEVRICFLHGMAGIGKTSLAARFAYRFRSCFPDGVLWARLDVSDTMSILSAFAGAYGRDVSEYMDVGSRSQVVREILADKEALLVLDNARSSEEIRPLLPPSRRCAVIVTTRRRDLAASWGASRIDLSPFDREKHEALELFTTILGGECLQAETAILSELADLLGHLPLAVAIAASRLAYESGRSAEEFLRRVKDERSPLEELACEDQSVRFSFRLSYDTLTGKQKQLFAALGAFGGEDFSVPAAAATADIEVPEAREQLRTLFNLSLVHVGRDGRYRLHPLLHDFARQAITDAGVFGRMVAYFLTYLEEHVADADFEALDRELDNILHALEVAYQQQMLPELIRGVNAIWSVLETKGLYTIGEHHIVRAEEAARLLDDSANLPRLLRTRGHIARIRGDYQQASEHLLQGLTLANRTDDRSVIGSLLRELGVVADMRADYDQAEAYFQEALARISSHAEPERVISMLMALSTFEMTRGDCATAHVHAQEGLRLARETEHPGRIAEMLLAAGIVADKRGDYEQARRYLAEALTVARDIEYGMIMASSLMGLGIVTARCGSFTQASDYLHEGLEMARNVGQSWSVGRLLNEWGAVCLERDEPAAAREAFQESLRIARATGAQALVGEATFGCARIRDRQGEVAKAEQLGRRSLAILQNLDHYLAPTVERWLAALADP